MKILSLFLVLAAAGCAVLSGPSAPSQTRTITLAADYDRSFTAVLSYCTEHSYPVVVTDYPAGIISTAYRPTNPPLRGIGAAFRTRCKFRLSRIEADRTCVVALAIIEQAGRSGQWEEARATEAAVQEFYDGVFRDLVHRLPQTR